MNEDKKDSVSIMDKVFRQPKTLEEAKKRIMWGDIISLVMWILIFGIIYFYRQDVNTLADIVGRCVAECPSFTP